MDALDERCPKTSEYLRLIERHVIDPLRGTELRDSCLATLLLLFGCADGLGKLLHSNDDAPAGTRFKLFISRLGRDYEGRKKLLWRLRNSLAHNALNVGSFVSRISVTEDYHLKLCQSTGMLFLNTRVLLHDFCEALRELGEELLENSALATQVESRLEWCEVHASEFEEIATTPPPPVRLVRSRD